MRLSCPLEGKAIVHGQLASGCAWCPAGKPEKPYAAATHDRWTEGLKKSGSSGAGDVGVGENCLRIFRLARFKASKGFESSRFLVGLLGVEPSTNGL